MALGRQIEIASQNDWLDTGMRQVRAFLEGGDPVEVQTTAGSLFVVRPEVVAAIRREYHPGYAESRGSVGLAAAGTLLRSVTSDKNERAIELPIGSTGVFVRVLAEGIGGIQVAPADQVDTLQTLNHNVALALFND